MDIYDLIEDLKAFKPDMSEYAPVRVAIPGAFKGNKHSEETKKKMSETTKRNYLDPAHRTKMSIAISLAYSTPEARNANSLRAKAYWTPEARKARSEKYKGKMCGANHPNSRAVLCINTNKTYTNIKECAEEYQVNPTTVSRWCTRGIDFRFVD